MTVTNSLHKLVLGSTVLVLTLGSVTAYAGKIKCWKNSDGFRECGNTVPPEYAQKGHDELNSQGIRVKSIERALTKDEIIERKRIKAVEKAKQDAIKAKQRQDMVLLNTFANEDEIVMARNGKITALRTEIRLTYKSLNKAKVRLIESRKLAANFERSGKKVPQKVSAEVAMNQKQIENYEQFITSKKAELNKINSQFDSDLKRFRVLRKPRKITTQR